MAAQENPDTLVTDRLLLRRIVLDDAPAFHAMNTLPAVIRFVGNQPSESIEQTREMLKHSALADYEKHGHGRFAVVWRETGEMIGFCGVKHLPQIAEDELGYRLRPEFWGKGVATEACRAVIDHARDILKKKRLVSVIHPENEASKNVVRKLGFAYEKTVRLDFMGELDNELYSRAL